MKNTLSVGLFIVMSISTSCTNKVAEQVHNKVASQIEIFSDSDFTFLHLDSIDEEMLRDRSVEDDYKYLKSVKRFRKEHCDYFKTGCSGTFFDENVFLVSKQNKIDEITPVIIHDSNDFNYYHSTLYTLNRENSKVDSLMVSLYGADMAGDEPPYSIRKVRSRFDGEFIITTELKYELYDRDSTVTVDSTVVYRKMQTDGRIVLLDKEEN